MTGSSVAPITHAGQKLALAAEALFDGRRRQRQRDHFHRGYHAKGSIRALGQVHGAHAAAPQQFQRLPGPEARQPLGSRRHRGADPFVVFEQAADLGP